MRYMLDTNICIHLIRERAPTVLDRLRRCRTGEIGVSVVTVAELQYGVSTSQRPDQNRAALSAFLLPLEVAELSIDAASVYGNIRAALEREGRPIGPFDLLIAAHALSRDVVLVTNTTREFARVEGLRVEDWTSPSPDAL